MEKTVDVIEKLQCSAIESDQTRHGKIQSENKIGQTTPVEWGLPKTKISQAQTAKIWIFWRNI